MPRFRAGAGAERMIFLGDMSDMAPIRNGPSTRSWIWSTGERWLCSAITTARSAPGECMNAEAQAAIEWTRGRLGAEQRRFSPACRCVAGGRPPLRAFRSQRAGKMALRPQHRRRRAQHHATPAHVTFCGHVHRPALYSMSTTAKMTSFVPTTGVPVQLLPAGMACRARLGRPAARRQSRGVVCDVRYRQAGNHLLPRALRCRGGSAAHPRRRPAALAGRSAARSGGEAMARRGSTRRGHRWLTVGELRPPRRHGDAVARDPRRISRAAADENSARRRRARTRRPSSASRWSR